MPTNPFDFDAPTPPQRKTARPEEPGNYSGNIQNIIHVNTGGGFPHTMHLLLTIFTCGLWAPVWLVHYLIRGGR